MDIAKREMERKRKALLEAKQKMISDEPSSSNSVTVHRRKFMKTSDVRRILEEEEEMKEKKKSASASAIKNETINASNNESNEEASHLPDSATRTKNPTLQTSRDDNEDNKGDATRHKLDSKSSHLMLQQHTTLEAVQRELRRLGLPVTYFGETSVGQRLQRLQQAQTHQSIRQLQEREADEFRLGQGFGIRNTYLEKDAAGNDNGMSLKATDFQEDDHDRNSSKKRKDRTDAGSSNDNNNNNNKHQNHEGAATTTTPEVDEDDNDKHKRIYKHFKGLLKQWENDLNQRSDDVKRSLAGRNETKKVKQCKDYIRPLFQLCKRRQLDDNMADKLYAMVLFCEEGEFVRAHDAYMDIAIGRAAWPIGVTMVGIHARTGRAKIESSNVAHVMNSELQRKYLTSVKRLLTYEQNQRTDVDPSKKVR